MSLIGTGVIGSGMMGTIFAEILPQEPLVRLVGVPDIAPVASNALAHRFAIRAFEDYCELLDVDWIDAVIVATSDQNHRNPCVEEASRRKHFMVEKPLGTTEEDARAMAVQWGCKTGQLDLKLHEEDVLTQFQGAGCP